MEKLKKLKKLTVVGRQQVPDEIRKEIVKKQNKTKPTNQNKIWLEVNLRFEAKSVVGPQTIQSWNQQPNWSDINWSFVHFLTYKVEIVLDQKYFNMYSVLTYNIVFR